MIFAPAYRMTIFAPRSIDASEATVLTPVAGAAHSDPFQVTTLASLPGYKPYLQLPMGRRGRIDVLTRTTDIGVMTFDLLDPKLSASDQLTRWVTAFFGNIKGEYRAGGLKTKVQESLTIAADGTRTWADWWTGRLQTVALKTKAGFTIGVQDEASEFTQQIFVGRPHTSITYAGVASLAPIGSTVPYGSPTSGGIAAVTPFTAVAQTLVLGGFTQPNTMNIVLDASQWHRPDLIVTANLLGVIAPGTVYYSRGFGVRMANYSGPGRAVLTHTSGALNGQTGLYAIGSIGTDLSTASAQGYHSNLRSFPIQALPAGELGALALPANGVAVQGYIIAGDVLVDDAHPLLIDTTSPILLLQDILAGKFGYIYHYPETLPTGKNYGDVKRAYAVNSANFTPFLNDATYPPIRFVIKQHAKMGQWIQDNLLKPYSLALYVDGAGQVNLTDLRLPSTLAGIATLTDADLISATDSLNWTFDRAQSISRIDAKYYTDRFTTVENINRDPADYPTFTPGPVQSIENLLITLAIGSGDFGDQSYSMDAQGYRTLDGETFPANTVGAPSRAAYLEGKLVEHGNTVGHPFAVGGTFVPLKCRRTGNVPTQPGSLLLLSLSALPDPSSNKRGGLRLVRVVEIGQRGLAVDLRCLDMAIAVVSLAPSASQPTQEASNTSIGVTTTVTLNASGQPAEIRYAVTATSVGAAPANTSSAWVLAPAGTNPITATGAVTFRPSTPGQRVWVQVRTMPVAGTLPQLPSNWVLAAGTGYVDLAAWAAPSALVKSNDTGRQFTVSWTNGATDLMVQILIRTPVGDPATLIATLPAGSTNYLIVGVDPSTTYRVGVRYTDGRNIGPETTADFTTAASSRTAPAISSLTVLY